MSNTKLFYTYRDSVDGKEKLLNALSAYSDSIIFDEDNRRIWHRGHQYGNTYWGSYHGEIFNDFINNTASGDYSHAEGTRNTAYGNYSHAEGTRNIAYGDSSHVEGIRNIAYGIQSHAEGARNTTYGTQSHVEGSRNITYGLASHAEGFRNIAYGGGSHAEGEGNIAYGTDSHTEGEYTYAEGRGAHTEGNYSSAYGDYSHAEGSKNAAYGEASHAEGKFNTTYGRYSHAEGQTNTTYGRCSHAEGQTNTAYGDYSHAEGYKNETYGEASHAEGKFNITYGDWSHAEGWVNITYGADSHAEGQTNTTYGEASHAEGFGNIAYGEASHAEGDSNTTYGANSHAEGFENITYGDCSHAEGHQSKAAGLYSHAEGDSTLAYGDGSHTQGYHTVAYNDYEATFGQFNVSTTGETVFSIGDGVDNDNRHNIIDFRKNGDMHKNGNSYFHDNIYGPVSNTYVESLGESATLDIVLSSLLTQPEYTRPNIIVKYSHSGNIEIGTYIMPTITLNWPTRTEQNTSGTRAYTLENSPSMPNYLLGYSYGIKGISLKYNNGANEDGYTPNNVNADYNYEYNGEGLNDFGLGKSLPLSMKSATYILDESTYVLSNKITITYLPYSYMYFQQLYEKNVYVHAYGLPPKEWTNGGTLTIGSNNTVYGKLKYYYGFSGNAIDLNGGNVPGAAEIKKSTSGWLSESSGTSEISISTLALNANASKYCFWIAYPDTTDNTADNIKNKHYKLVANSDKFKIEVLMKDGMNFDLISPDQPLKSTHIDLPIGNIKTPSGDNLTIRYKIAFVDFQKPIGNVNNILKFSIAPIRNSKNAII